MGFLGFGALCGVGVIQVFWFVALVVWVLHFWVLGFGGLGVWNVVGAWIGYTLRVLYFGLCWFRVYGDWLCWVWHSVGLVLVGFWLGGLTFEVGWGGVGYYCFLVCVGCDLAAVGFLGLLGLFRVGII